MSVALAVRASSSLPGKGLATWKTVFFLNIANHIYNVGILVMGTKIATSCFEGYIARYGSFG